ncbi:MAG: DUF1684 domain-containing protein [Flavobacteriaceae bacterium]|nr:DUF1684 domain-containing protein [Flavobacteriaceae bacterium]
MKSYLLSIAFVLLSLGCSKKENETQYVNDIKEHRYNMNVKFSNKETTILSGQDFETFKALDFFPIDTMYKIKARFVRTPNEIIDLFATSTDRKQPMLKYGEAYFSLKGKELKLNIYQTEGIGDEYVNYLFIPFMDATSGHETYGGGRYINTRAPKNNILLIDFNKAFNPPCAYNYNYSCVIPPKENRLPIAIEAGIKNYTNSGNKK